MAAYDVRPFFYVYHYSLFFEFVCLLKLDIRLETSVERASFSLFEEDQGAKSSVRCMGNCIQYFMEINLMITIIE